MVYVQRIIKKKGPDFVGQNDELNERVAEITGWERQSLDAWLSPSHSFLGVTARTVYRSLPDFCSDNHALGWMVDWLDTQGCVTAWGIGKDDDGSVCGWVGTTDSSWYFHGDTLNEAFARAIVAYAEASAEGQKEGAE